MHANPFSKPELSRRMFVLTVYFLFVFLLCAICADEDISANNTIKLNVNETGNITEFTTDTPIQRKDEQLDGSSDIKNSSVKEFRPSPQLENAYEFNKKPVIPVVGEAKQLTNIQSQANARTFFWPMSDTPNKQPATTTEATWVRRVIFPHSTVETTRDQPYPFVTSNHPSATQFGSFESRPPPRIPPTLSSYYGSSGLDSSRGYGYNPSKWDQFASSGLGATKGPVITHKTNYEGYGLPEASPGGVSKISPIKKIIGLLAAFIPLGLLISALTPSVIQVVPMNTTQSRSRSNIQNTSTKRLVSSLNTLAKIEDTGCEERILCELLLSAGASKNAEEHVENLLQTFTEQERDAVQKAEELRRIYGAVKSQDCKSLACRDIEMNQKKKKLKDKL